MIINVILFLLIGISCFLLVDYFVERNLNQKITRYFLYKSEKYYSELIKRYEKKKKLNLKLNLIHRIYLLMEQAGCKISIFFNPITIIFLCVLVFFVFYYIVFKIFNIILLSVIISLPTILIPIVILNILAESKSKKIEKTMLNFLLQIKNYTQINNDILYAFKEVKAIEPLNSYIKRFLLEINSGVKFEKAIENLKEKITFQNFKMFFTNIQYCYLYGGNFSELITKNYKMISAIQEEKNHREQETLSARIVLGVLIILDLFVYFTFIKDNYENYKIMTESFLGNMILYWNFISIWLLIFLMHKVKKLDY